MAKKSFLDSIGDAFGDDVLLDVIPERKPRAKNSKPASNTPATKTPARRSNRKKFTDSIDQRLQESKPARTTGGKRKSFLDTIEEALDSNAFDDIIPKDRNWKKGSTKQRSTSKEDQLESRFSTMITTEVLDRAKEIAKMKGIRVKDVINKALKLYLDTEGK